MTPAPERVLLYGFAEDAPVLASRVRALGYETLAASEPRAAAGLMTRDGPRVGAVLLPAGLPLSERGDELDHLRRAAGPFGIGFVVVGASPDEAARAALREHGVRLCLWEPFQEHELRFVLNRAAFDPSAPAGEAGHAEARLELRVPTELSAEIRAGGRTKPARIYSLSAAGCFLETLRPSLVGGRLEVALTLPAGELCLAGRVVLTNVPGNLQRPKLPCGMGVEFRQLPPEAREALEAYVHERARAYEL
ncbi:MAG: PilZ domain-containing protein [Myxococcota bacterium]